MGAVGVGAVGAGTGDGVVGATGPDEMEISAQFQNCSVVVVVMIRREYIICTQA